MAFTGDTYDNAIWTDAVERTPTGVRGLPWAFLQLGGPGEDRRYVVPMAGISHVGTNGTQRRYVGQEIMPNLAFPLDSGAPRRGSGTLDSDKPGPLGVHFFGRV